MNKTKYIIMTLKPRVVKMTEVYFYTTNVRSNYHSNRGNKTKNEVNLS